MGRLLKPGGIFVMEAITTPESRYKEYLKARVCSDNVFMSMYLKARVSRC